MSPPAGVVDGLLAGRYRLVTRIGTGSNGDLWRARDERLERDVAVEVLRPELADDEDARVRFRREARAAGGLRSPGIAAVLDVAADDDGAFLVVQLVDGQPLSEVLRRSGRLSVDRTLDVVGQTAAALQVAHDGGVVHGDVRPGNLLVCRDGQLVVTGFGVAHAPGAASCPSPGQVAGTPVSPADDLYALGVVAHGCLSGAVVHGHLPAPPPPLPADVPPAAADLVTRLLAEDPAGRPGSGLQVQREAVAVRRALVTGASAVAAAPVPAGTATAVAPAAAAARPAVLGLAGRPGQRRAVRATAVALGLLAVALGVRDATRTDAAPLVDVPERRPPSSAPPAGGELGQEPGHAREGRR